VCWPTIYDARDRETYVRYAYQRDLMIFCDMRDSLAQGRLGACVACASVRICIQRVGTGLRLAPAALAQTQRPLRSACATPKAGAPLRLPTPSTLRGEQRKAILKPAAVTALKSKSVSVEEATKAPQHFFQYFKTRHGAAQPLRRHTLLAKATSRRHSIDHPSAL